MNKIYIVFRTRWGSHIICEAFGTRGLAEDYIKGIKFPHELNIEEAWFTP